MKELIKRFEKETGNELYTISIDKGEDLYNTDFVEWMAEQLALCNVPRWVACKDAMPDKEKEYLCYNGKFVDFYKYRKEWKQFDHGVIGVDTEVTHWREVPEPPC